MATDYHNAAVPLLAELAGWKAGTLPADNARWDAFFNACILYNQSAWKIICAGDTYLGALGVAVESMGHALWIKQLRRYRRENNC